MANLYHRAFGEFEIMVRVHRCQLEIGVQSEFLDDTGNTIKLKKWFKPSTEDVEYLAGLFCLTIGCKPTREEIK